MFIGVRVVIVKQCQHVWSAHVVRVSMPWEKYHKHVHSLWHALSNIQDSLLCVWIYIYMAYRRPTFNLGRNTDQGNAMIPSAAGLQASPARGRAWEHPLLLYCNAHYLFGLSRASEAVLKTEEKSMTAATGGRMTAATGGLGRDALPKFNHFKSACETATSRVIRTASDIFRPRGDEKNGCRAEWQGFCEINGRKSTVPCYRSNRFNCYFECAMSTKDKTWCIFFERICITFKFENTECGSRSKGGQTGCSSVCSGIVVLSCHWALLESSAKQDYVWHFESWLSRHLWRRVWDQQMAEHVNFSVRDSGFVIHREYPEIGASPDGITWGDCHGEVPIHFTRRGHYHSERKSDLPVERHWRKLEVTCKPCLLLSVSSLSLDTRKRQQHHVWQLYPMDKATVALPNAWSDQTRTSVVKRNDCGKFMPYTTRKVGSICEESQRCALVCRHTSSYTRKQPMSNPESICKFAGYNVPSNNNNINTSINVFVVP